MPPNYTPPPLPEDEDPPDCAVPPPIPDRPACTLSILAQRFADIGNVADSHANIAKDSAASNRNANAVLHRVLNLLEELLSDKKADVSRLLVTLSQLRPVTHRLAKTGRQIISRLTSYDPDAMARFVIVVELPYFCMVKC
ncbi:hypothetical protein Aduo_018635 [Ancylostoma duodenale]